MREVRRLPGAGTSSIVATAYARKSFRGELVEAPRVDEFRASMQGCATVVMRELMKVQPGEKVLIITNPGETEEISRVLANATRKCGAIASVVVEEPKRHKANADPKVLKAIAAGLDVVLLILEKDAFLGKDPKRESGGYEVEGRHYDHVFGMLLGEGLLRAAWANSINIENFLPTAGVDYEEMRRKGAKIKALIDGLGDNATVRIRNCGAELTIRIKPGSAKVEAGPYDKPGMGGNIPAGEVETKAFEVNGTLALAGPVETRSERGTFIPKEPIFITFKNSKIDTITGPDSGDLRWTLEHFKTDILGPLAETFMLEFGIGLNPGAILSAFIVAAEKKRGSAYVSLNKKKNGEKLHLDCSLGERPEIEIGDTLVLQGGKLLI